MFKLFFFVLFIMWLFVLLYILTQTRDMYYEKRRKMSFCRCFVCVFFCVYIVVLFCMNVSFKLWFEKSVRKFCIKQLMCSFIGFVSILMSIYIMFFLSLLMRACFLPTNCRAIYSNAFDCEKKTLTCADDNCLVVWNICHKFHRKMSFRDSCVSVRVSWGCMALWIVADNIYRQIHTWVAFSAVCQHDDHHNRYALLQTFLCVRSRYIITTEETVIIIIIKVSR